MNTMREKTRSLRSGKYVRQPAGYSAFIPEPLPPKPPIEIDKRLQTLLSKADRALGRLDGTIHTLPDSDLFVAMYIRKEAVLSSQIEGTQSSLHDVLEAEASILRADRPKDVPEVLNYIAAMNHGLGRLQDLPVSQRLIREIHRRLLKGVRGQERQPGEIRNSQNWIGPPGCGLDDAIFVPPPAQDVPAALANLENFIHRETDTPSLMKLGIVHAQFETIHPFLDGNGRVGRLLIALLLCERKILIKPVLYLSYYFKRHKQEYYDHLQSIRFDGDWEGWLRFFLQGVVEVANEAVDLSREISRLRETDRGRIVASMGRAAGNGIAVLELLFRKPIITISIVKDVLDMTYQGASGIVRRLVSLGILHEVSEHRRNRRFIYYNYVALFDEPNIIQ